MTKVKSSASILIVDDQDGWRILLDTILKDAGYKVTIAATFQDGSNLIQAGGFDLIILDMRLVDNSTYNIQGMTLLKQAKAQHPKTKAVLFTGFPDDMQKNRALSHFGADAYMEKVPDGKPLDIDEFLKLIAGLVAQQ